MDFYVLGQGAPSCFNVLFSSSAGTVPPTDDSLAMLSLLLSLLLEFSFSALAGQTQRPMGSHSGLYVKWACCVRHIFIYRSFVVITTEGLSCGFLVHSYLIKLGYHEFGNVFSFRGNDCREMYCQWKSFTVLINGFKRLATDGERVEKWMFSKMLKQ